MSDPRQTLNLRIKPEDRGPMAGFPISRISLLRLSASSISINPALLRRSIFSITNQNLPLSPGASFPIPFVKASALPA